MKIMTVIDNSWQNIYVHDRCKFITAFTEKTRN